jgi:glycosyltransferase involved in cell wall biosynthesis
VNIVHLSVGALPAPFGDSGGALQRRVAELAGEQSRRGHRVQVLAAERSGGRRTIDGVDVRLIRSMAPSPWLHLEHQLRSIVATARAGPVDVVHVHNEPEAALMGRRLNLPMLLHYDNYFFRGHGRLFSLYRRALLSYELLMPVSEYCRDESTKHWDLVPERCVVVPNGVNLGQFAPRAPEGAGERRRLTLKAGPVLLYVGRVCEQKGSDTLLEAFARLRAHGSDVQLLIAGPIGSFGTDPQAASGARWRDAMTRAGANYLGLVPEHRLAPLMCLADIFVMPTAELEMQGMAALEAQACGTPVIASDHGGLPETVPDSCGVRFPPGDCVALADAIASLLGDPDRRRILSDNARRHALSLSWPRICDRLEDAYERARAAHESSPRGARRSRGSRTTSGGSASRDGGGPS